MATNELVFLSVSFTVSANVMCEDIEFDFNTLPDEMTHPIVDDEDYETITIDEGGGGEEF